MTHKVTAIIWGIGSLSWFAAAYLSEDMKVMYGAIGVLFLGLAYFFYRLSGKSDRG